MNNRRVFIVTLAALAVGGISELRKRETPKPCEAATAPPDGNLRVSGSVVPDPPNPYDKIIRIGDASAYNEICFIDTEGLAWKSNPDGTKTPLVTCP